MHVHAKKADMECKFWLDVDTFDISLAYAYKMSPRATREIRKIIFPLVPTLRVGMPSWPLRGPPPDATQSVFPCSHAGAWERVRKIRKIIFSHFDYIVDQWEAFQKKRRT